MSAQYTRLFLWTTPTFYSPFQLWRSLANKYYLESVAGSFDDEFSEKVAIAPAPAAIVESAA